MTRAGDRQFRWPYSSGQFWGQPGQRRDVERQEPIHEHVAAVRSYHWSLPVSLVPVRRNPLYRLAFAIGVYGRGLRGAGFRAPL